MKQETIGGLMEQQNASLTPQEEAMRETVKKTTRNRKPYTVKDYVKKYFIPTL